MTEYSTEELNSALKIVKDFHLSNPLIHDRLWNRFKQDNKIGYCNFEHYIKFAKLIKKYNTIL